MRRFGVITACMALLMVLNLFWGSVHIDASQVMDVLMGRESDAPQRFIILSCRLPQMVTALLVGAAVSVAGLLLQTTFQNPLAGPGVLGISGGASLGVAVVVLCGSLLNLQVPFWGQGCAALVGALLVTVALVMLSLLVRNNLLLLITGLLFGYLVSALISIMNVVASAESLQAYVIWGLADFSGVSNDELPLMGGLLLAFMVVSVLMVKSLNILQLGNDYARSLGLNIILMRNMLLLLVGAITAVTTAWCGPVSFLGLAVPHMARLFFRDANMQVLLPATMLMGGVVALLCNLLCVIPDNTVLPLNAVTPLVGVPVIIYVLLRPSR